MVRRCVGEPSDAKNQTCTLTHPFGESDGVFRIWTVFDGRLFLLGEHVLQAFEDRENRLSLKLPERLHKPLRINRPELIERHEARASLKTASRTPRVCTSASCHRRHDDCPEVIIQFVRGHDHAWPRLPDFATERGIESNEMDLTAADWWTAYRHSHSSRSN